MTPVISTDRYMGNALTSKSSIFSVVAVLMVEIFYMLFYAYDGVQQAENGWIQHTRRTGFCLSAK